MKAKIFEVGPRDGLQNESQILTLDQKKEFINLLIEAGHKDIEAGAFVRADKIPQMANSEELLGSLAASRGVQFWSLVPNAKGFERALQSGVQCIAIFTAATDSFNKANTNVTVAESFEKFNEFVPQAKKKKMKIRGYVSTAFGCPYEGKVDPKKVYAVAEKLADMGCDEISIGDTIGVGNPMQVRKMTPRLAKIVGMKKLAYHFHDTRGTALANILEALENGVRIFDSSSAGIGGCPYAPGASGNVATDDVLYMLQEMGIETGISLEKQTKAGEYLQSVLGRKLPSKYLQAALSSRH